MKGDTEELLLLCSHHSQCCHICSQACDLHGVRLQVSLSRYSVPACSDCSGAACSYLNAHCPHQLL